MATPVFCCGFECGQFGSVGQHWANTGSVSFSTTIFRGTSGRSLRFNPAATTAKVVRAVAGSNINVIRFYIYFASLPTSSIQLCFLNTDGGVSFKHTDSKIYAGATNLGTTGVSVTTGQWYRIDCKVDVSSGDTVTDVQVDGVACGQALAIGTSAFNSVTLGEDFNYTADMYMDDVLCSATLADYPLGAGKVVSLVANADGTHTSTGTNIVKGTTGTPVGSAITSSTTDAFNWLNARPIGGGATDNTRLINQQTLAGTEYVEILFENSSELVAPRAVELLVIDRQAATQTGSMIIKALVGTGGTWATDDIVVRAGSAGVASDRYTSKQYRVSWGTGSQAWAVPGGSGANDINTLGIRFGFSGDATPDQYIRGAMYEIEFPEVDAPKLPAPKIYSQAVHRSNFY